MKTNLSLELRYKLNKVREMLHSLQPGVIAASGGIDSRLLSSLCNRWDLDYMVVFFETPLLSPRQTEQAKEFLNSLSLKSCAIKINPLIEPKVGQNDTQRCYFCKKFLFNEAISKINPDQYKHFLDASNSSDHAEYRPGLKALKELGIISPLAKAFISKQDIRKLATELELFWSDQPSSPCLLTRFAYNLSPSRKQIKQIAHAEDALTDLGLKNFRLRMLTNQDLKLQMSSQARDFWSRKQKQIQNILVNQGLQSVEPIFTEQLSGFFDLFPCPNGHNEA